MSDAQPKKPPVSEPEAVSFDVSAAKIGSRQRYALKCNDTFAIVDAHGDLNAEGSGADGLYHADTRYLSRLRLSVMGADPLLLGSSLAHDGTYARADLTNSDIVRDGRVILAKDQVHIERTFYVHSSGFSQRLLLTNYGQSPIDLPLTIAFDNDFADIFEVRGMSRARRGTRAFELGQTSSVTLRYRGLDEVTRATQVSFSVPPASLSRDAAHFVIGLKSNENAIIETSVGINAAGEQSPKSFLSGLVGVRKDATRKARQCEVSTGNTEVNSVLRRAAADAALLMTRTPSGLYPYAGVPWFSTVFGRDGIITALELLWVHPEMARGVLRFLAAHQSTDYDALSDAEPGKILHEMRGGEMAMRKEVPFGAYYGSVDSTPLFVVLAGRYWRRTGDDALVRELWGNIEAALAWMDGAGDRDGDGFIEYHRATPSGLANQGWKDSGDSIFHADGMLCAGPVALVEVQAYAYEAKVLAAAMAGRLGDERRSQELSEQAAQLKRRFEAAFWSDELGCYVLALDGDKRPCLVLSSNAGQVLQSGIAEPDRERKVAAAMLSPALFSGWGIRTLAQGAMRYNPMSYHNGSIWPHDNALIAAGMARVDRDGPELLLRALVDAAVAMDQHRLPELFCGFQRRRGRAPVLYPVACSPQAWSSGALFHILQAVLGIEIDGHASRIRVSAAQLPEWLGCVSLKGLSIGRGLCSLRIEAGPRDVPTVTILNNTAEAEVRIE